MRRIITLEIGVADFLKTNTMDFFGKISEIRFPERVGQYIEKRLFRDSPPQYQRAV